MRNYTKHEHTTMIQVENLTSTKGSPPAASTTAAALAFAMQHADKATGKTGGKPAASKPRKNSRKDDFALSEGLGDDLDSDLDSDLDMMDGMDMPASILALRPGVAPDTTPEAASDTVAPVMDRALRPTRFHDFVGQQAIMQQLDIATRAARARGEPLDHTLFYGPPGLGKTTLSTIIAAEIGGNLYKTSGPVLEKPKDIAALLTTLNRGDVLFVDEIHRMPVSVEETLFSALEDFCIDIMIGEGPAARSVRLPLEPFTLVGATTRLGMLSAPLRDRFGITCRLDLYQPQEMKSIISTNMQALGMSIPDEVAGLLSHCVRGTPRIANRMLRRIRDVACIMERDSVDMDVAQRALQLLQIQPNGLDEQDWRYLLSVHEQFDGGPVGLESLAAILGEDGQTLEDAIEPYLLQQGLIQRTPRGRMLTDAGRAMAASFHPLSNPS